MKTTIKLLALVILVTFSSCKNSKKIDYKYAESPKLLACDFPNGELLKEAVYAFENDIINNYDMESRNATRAYSSYLRSRSRNNANAKDIASLHSLEIAKALKEDSSLWTTTNGVNLLDRSHALMDCIVNNIKDKNTKTTYKALLATNSLKPNLILPLLNGNTGSIRADGNLKSYIALDLFYSQLLNVKIEELKNPSLKPQPAPAKPAVQGLDLNKTPKDKAPVNASTQKGHEGHNHD